LGGLLFAVPDLTGSADINLNQLVVLRACPERLFVNYRTIVERPGPHLAKPSGEHIPLGGFVSVKGQSHAMAEIKRGLSISTCL
jgi:hypothetical protein